MKRASYWSGAARGLSGERGSIAVIAVLGMALLLVITVAFVALAQLETKIGVNHAQEIQATQAAEAGARRVFRAIADGTDSGATWVSNTATTPITGTLTGGLYSVQVLNTIPAGSDVAVTSTGRSMGARSVVTLLVSPATYPQHALDMAGYVKINGSPTVQGSKGSVYVYTSGTDRTDTTVDIDVTGSPVVAQGMSTDSVPSASVGNSKYCKVAGCANPGLTPDYNQAVESFPTVDPTKYGKYVDFLFNSDGWVYSWKAGEDAGTFCTNKTSDCPAPSTSNWDKITLADDGSTATSPKSTKCFKGLQWEQSAASNQPAGWKDCSNTSYDFVNGTYYVKGELKTSHAHSTAKNTTIIAEANINLTQQMAFQGDNASGNGPNPTFPKDILLVAGTDVLVTNALNVRGVIAAHEQIQLNNGGTYYGMLIAENSNENGNSWPTSDGTVKYNTINGSPTITYNGDMQPAGLGTAGSVTKWVGR